MFVKYINNKKLPKLLLKLYISMAILFLTKNKLSLYFLIFVIFSSEKSSNITEDNKIEGACILSVMSKTII